MTVANPHACPSCQTGVLEAEPITEKRRVKFGLLWVVITILTGGLGLLLWLVMPRRSVTTGYVNQCSSCGHRLA